MISVMLVEDEALLRKGMRRHIPWKEYGFEVTAEAADGKEALKIMENQPLDVVFLDIRMPGLGGLEFLQRLRETNQQTDVVIVSGYDEFDYAKTALRFGAYDYLLKPLDIGQVTAVLKRLKNKKIDERHAHVSRKAMHKKYFEAGFYGMINNGWDGKEYERFIAEIRNKYESHSFQLIYLATRRNKFGRLPKENFIFLQEMKGLTDSYVIELHQFGFFLFLVHQQGQPLPLSHIVDQCLKNKNIAPLLDAIYYSACFSGWEIEKYQKMMADKRRLFAWHFYNTEKKRQVHPSELVEREMGFAPGPHRRETFIGEWVNLHENNVKKELSDLYFALKATPAFRPDSVRNVYIEWVERGFDKMRDNYGDGFFSDEFMARRIQELQHCSRLLELHRTTMKIVSEGMQRTRETRQDDTQKLIKEMKKYIYSHLDEDIFLQDLSNHFNYSRQHLSALFKRETGKSYNQFLQEARIHRAKEILQKNFTIKTYDLASSVGYQDPKYFSSIFKEATGLTPREYAQKLN